MKAHCFVIAPRFPLPKICSSPLEETRNTSKIRPLDLGFLREFIEEVPLN